MRGKKKRSPFLLLLIFVNAHKKNSLASDIYSVMFHQLFCDDMLQCFHIPTFPRQAFSCSLTTPRESYSNSVVRAKEQAVPVKGRQTHSPYFKCNMSLGAEMCNTVSSTVTLSLWDNWTLAFFTRRPSPLHSGKLTAQLDSCCRNRSWKRTSLVISLVPAHSVSMNIVWPSIYYITSVRSNPEIQTYTVTGFVSREDPAEILAPLSQISGA